jgi:hypothetical protein
MASYSWFQLADRGSNDVMSRAIVARYFDLARRGPTRDVPVVGSRKASPGPAAPASRAQLALDCRPDHTDRLAGRLNAVVSRRGLSASGASVASVLQRARARIQTPRSGEQQVDYEDEHFKSGADGTVHWGTMSGGGGEQVVVKKGKGEGGYAAIAGETAALRSLPEHANVVKVVGWNEEEHILVLRRADGSLVSKGVLASRTFSQRLSLALGALDGLVHIHERDWTHGDLNLKNILIFADTAAITDFGAAKQPETPDPIPPGMEEFAGPDTRSPDERRQERRRDDRKAMVQMVYNIVLGETQDAQVPVEDQVQLRVDAEDSPLPEHRREAFKALIGTHRAGETSLKALRSDLSALRDLPVAASQSSMLRVAVPSLLLAAAAAAAAWFWLRRASPSTD